MATPVAAPAHVPRFGAHPPSALTVTPVGVTPMPQNAAAAPAARPVTGPLGYPPPAPLDASISMPIAARRPWTLIIVVLLIDLGLAATGVWLLTQGLAAPHSAASSQR
jgi:hypothetical protein